MRSTILTLTMLLTLIGCAAPTPTSAPPTSTPSPPTSTPTPLPPTSTPLPPAPGDHRLDDRGVEQVWVPAGSFIMGTADTAGLEPPSWAEDELASEQPAHRVTLSTGYWIDVYEVTNEAFQAFVDDGGYTEEAWWSSRGWAWVSDQDVEDLPENCLPGAAPGEPRVCINWFEAEAYAAWRGGRLPTEAEWEYAARGPESLIYPWGNEFEPSLANVIDSTGLMPVGSYPGGISWIGVHDMAGNAMEWVQDWFSFDYYKDQVELNPPGPAGGLFKIEKGGWWGSNPYVARSAYRHFEDPPVYRDHHIGVRIVTPTQ